MYVDLRFICHQNGVAALDLLPDPVVGHQSNWLKADSRLAMVEIANKLMVELRHIEAFITDAGLEEAFFRTLVEAARFREVLESEFCHDRAPRYLRRKTQVERKLQNKLQYTRKVKGELQEKLKMMKGDKTRGILGHHVMIKICLSNPFINGRQLRELFSTEFDDGRKVVSHTSVIKLRDAFAETLKALSLQQVSRLLSAAPRTKPSVVLVHYHDEASMRFRSYDRVDIEHLGDGSDGNVFSRSRYSKVQNNAVFATVVPSKSGVEVFTDLQPLSRKGGATLATAITDIVKPVFTLCSGCAVKHSSRSIRVIHVLVGDGINTNENAAKRVLYNLRRRGAKERVEYRLALFKCSSHQSNLCVAVAIAGNISNDLVDRCGICGTLSRLYKHLLPSYLEEFTARLRGIVLDKMVICDDVDSDTTKAHQAQTQKMIELYGDVILPPELTTIVNRNLQNLEHVAPAGSDHLAITKANI